MADEKHRHSESAAKAPDKAVEARAPEKHDDCERRHAELNDKYLRMAAEYDNFKKRTVKEKEELARASEARAMLRLLPVYEELSLAEAEVGRLPDGEAKKGTMLVLSKLRATFEKEGLLRMKLEGERYDPFRHEVAFREESDAPEGSIVKVIKQGYLYKGEVLQHAIVSVSAGKKAEKPGKEEAEAKREEKKE